MVEVHRTLESQSGNRESLQHKNPCSLQTFEVSGLLLVYLSGVVVLSFTCKINQNR